MITTLVMLAFKRLAAADLIDMARNAGPNPNSADVERFMLEAFKQDERLSGLSADAMIFDEADPAAVNKEILLNVFRQVLDSIVRGDAALSKVVSDGDARQLMNYIHTLAEKAMKGEDRETKSVGMHDKLSEFKEGLASKDESTARNIEKFVQDVFSGEIEQLENQYWFSRIQGSTKGAVLSQEMGAQDARKGVHTQVFRMLLEGVWGAIEKETYRGHSSTAHTLGAISMGVSKRIHHGNTGDKFDIELSAAARNARRKVGQYIVPLLNTGQFGSGKSIDTLGITRFLNENVVHKDKPAGSWIDVPLPDGTTMKVKSYRTELKHDKILSWLSVATPNVSLEEPLSEGGESRAEAIGESDKPLSDKEEWQIEHLNSPVDPDTVEKLERENPGLLKGVHTNKDLVRAKLREWIEEATERAVSEGVREGFSDGKPIKRKEVPKDSEDAIRDIMLVKFGFKSEGTARNEFKRKWLGKHDLKYYATPMTDDKWKSIGSPLKKVRGGAEKVRRYTTDWEQSGALLNKETDNPPSRTSEVLEDPGDFKLVETLTHRKGEKADTRHFAEWHEYSREQREKEMDRVLDVYGPKWFEQSVDPSVLEELQRSQGDLAKVYEKFKPENMLVSVSKHTDQELVRTMGFIRPTIQPETKTLDPRYPFLANGIKSAMRILGRILEDRKNEDEVSVMQYTSLKSLGRVASAI